MRQLHFRPRRTHLLALLFWSLIWALFFGPILLGTERIAGGDFAGQFHAFARFQAAEMAAGRWPLWSDGSFGGIPFVADTQAAVFYLPRWLTLWLSRPWGMSYYALELEALLHVWLAGVGAYLFAASTASRAAEKNDNQEQISAVAAPLAGLVAALGFGLGGYLVSYPLIQLAVLETMAWLPFTLWLLHVGVRRRNLRWLVAAGALLALAFTAGHPQSFLHAAYVAAAYFVFAAVRAGWGWRPILGVGGLIGVIAVGGATAAWLPAIVYLPTTVRSNISYAFVSSGQELLNYIQLILPATRTLLTPEYVGLPTLFLALLALAQRGKAARGPRAEIVFWGFVALTAAWLALGDKGIIFELWYAVAPGFRLFRQQERLLSVLALALALLGGHGVTLWGELVTGQRRAAVRHTAFQLAGWVGLAAVVLAVASSSPWLATLGRQLLILPLTAALLYLPRNSSARPLILLTLLLAADLFLATRPTVETAAGPPSVFWPQPTWMTALQGEEGGRFDPGFLYFANVGEVYGVATVRGISPLKPQLLADLERLPLTRLWPLLAVTHGLFVGPPPADLAPQLTFVAAADESLHPEQPYTGVGLYRFEAALSKARLVYQPSVVADETAALERLNAPDFDAAAQVVLLAADAQLYTVEPPPTPPVVTITERQPGRVRLQAETATAGYLVISEWFVPGWRAWVNDRAAPILRANYGFQAVWLPAGAHEVVVAFRPWQVWMGMGVSAVVWLLVIGYLVRGYWVKDEANF